MRLATFGDSWPAGFGSKISYGEILKTLIGADEFVNMSKIATSNEHMLLQLNDFVRSNNNDQKTIAVFFLTSPTRSLYYDQGNPRELYPWDDESTGPQNYAYYKYLHSMELEHFRSNQTVLALQRICEQNSIKDYYLAGWHRFDLSWPGIDRSKIWKDGQETAADWIGAMTDGDRISWKDCDAVIPNDCHPNEKGHQIIAEKLSQWLACLG